MVGNWFKKIIHSLHAKSLSHIIKIPVAAYNDTFSFRRTVLHAGQQGKTIHNRHLYIGKKNMRTELLCYGQGIHPIPGSGNDLETGIQFFYFLLHEL